MENQPKNITQSVEPELVDGKVPEVVFTSPEKQDEQKKLPIVPITNVSQLMLYQSGTVSTAPTHSPRTIYEQLVLKDDGTTSALWIWSQYDKTWVPFFGPGPSSKSRAYLTADQTVAPVGENLLELDDVSYDLESEFNTTTHLFTAISAGYYQVNATVWWDTIENEKQYAVVIYKNAARQARGISHGSGATTLSTSVSDIVSLAVGDTISVYVEHNGAGNIDILAGAPYTFLSIHRLS